MAVRIINKQFELLPIIPNEKYYEVEIKADYNDADYISDRSKYTEEEFVKLVPYLKYLLKNHSGDNEFEKWYCDISEEYMEESGVSEDEMLQVPELPLPYSDWGTCHTLQACIIKFYDIDGKTYRVNLS